MFKEPRPEPRFSWADLGDIASGRPNLGQNVPVAVYRLLQYTLRDTLICDLGAQQADELFVKAGRLAGFHFCKNILDPALNPNEFLAALQQKLKELSVGILRIEKADFEKQTFTLTVAEDLDCSGLPCSEETVCQYDEGFIAGVFEAYTGKPFTAKEVDCWASGDRVCRFEVKRK